ncbi:fumarylacetoacetate hydrolase family protein [Cohnella terricola]|uniref:Fumarylacetoacetate hydrolase family protein n=1 Tax=Cohnella terricola TaxID=1289167 RepID=A0A559JKN7_9BACL|nr:fumarylacetoacetate hydrolase family protein [Cohnella terricola]TVY00443.1 fumarylacetoacetate hydrolase family protein [Cohnella terricola]
MNVNETDLRNIYCVGRNYRLHAAELGNEVPTSPMIFTKPTHAVIRMEDGLLKLPGSQGSIHYEAELVVAVGRPYEPGIRCDELFTAFTVGLDLTLRDVQERLKAKGQPWLAAKGFRNSAAFGKWLAFPGSTAIKEGDFAFRINDQEVQRGNANDMVFDLQLIADFVGTNYGLGVGDVLFTGTPAGVGALSDGDRLDVRWNEESLGRLTVAIAG